MSEYLNEHFACILDIDECSLAAQNNTDLCTPPMICSNTDGGFECLCPAGTEAAGGTCIPIGTVLVSLIN